MGFSSRPVLPGCFHPFSAWRDIPSGRDDFLHVNRNRWDIPPCRDEIDVTAHAFNPRTMRRKYFAGCKMADMEAYSPSLPSPASSCSFEEDVQPNAKKTKFSESSTKFRWTPEMVTRLISCLLEYTTTCAYNNVDFDADRSVQYKVLRKELAKRYPETFFGPVDEAASMVATKQISAQERKKWEKKKNAERARISYETMFLQGCDIWNKERKWKGCL